MKCDGSVSKTREEKQIEVSKIRMISALMRPKQERLLYWNYLASLKLILSLNENLFYYNMLPSTLGPYDITVLKAAHHGVLSGLGSPAIPSHKDSSPYTQFLRTQTN